MRILVQNNRTVPIQNRFKLFATMIEDVGCDHRGKPSSFRGPIVSPSEMQDGSLVFNLPYVNFGGKHRLFAVNCISQHGPVRGLDIGPAWSMIVSGSQDPSNVKELEFPSDTPKMNVTVEGGEIIVSALVDPARDDNIFGRGPIDRAAREYVNLKEAGIIAQLERGEFPAPSGMQDNFDFSPGR